MDGDALPFELSRKCRAFHDGDHVGTVTDLIWSPRLERNIGYVWMPIALADPSVALEVEAPDGGMLASANGRHPVPRSEEGRPEVMTTSETSAGLAGPLTAEEIAAVRKPYRAASLLPGRAYHEPAIHDFERRCGSGATG